MTKLPRSARRVQDAASQLGLDIEVVEMPESTRTAQEAAEACGCELGQIVKSLIFQGSRHEPAAPPPGIGNQPGERSKNGWTFSANL